MAGLLAWAADVVAGNGNALSNNDGNEDRAVSSRIRFTPQQQDELRQLDERASVLQHTIQQLRQRIPPADISRSLPQLHADYLAAQTSITVELNSHQTTQNEAKIREESLRSENANYARAIKSVEKQIQEKAVEKVNLEDTLQNLEKDLSFLVHELDKLDNSEANDIDESMHEDEKPETILSTRNKALMQEEELQKTRKEFKEWQAKLSNLENEWKALVQNSNKWPSVAQREKDLERRLRTLAEQLVTKQAQVDMMTKERRDLEFRLRKVTEIHRQLQMANSDTSFKRTSIGRLGLPSASSTSVSEGPKEYIESIVREFRIRGFAAGLQLAAQELPAVFYYFSGLDGKMTRQQLHKFTIFRAIVVAYILSLHIIAFAIIAFTN